MRVRVWAGLLAAVLCAGWLAMPWWRATAAGAERRPGEDEGPSTQGRRVPCSKIMSAVHRELTATKGRSADLTLVAKRFGTSIVWVERCMQAYGKRVVRPGLESPEGREARLRRLEEDEPEETFREDAEEPGACERPPPDEVERPLRATPRPTPDEFGHAEDE